MPAKPPRPGTPPKPPANPDPSALGAAAAPAAAAPAALAALRCGLEANIHRATEKGPEHAAERGIRHSNAQPLWRCGIIDNQTWHDACEREPGRGQNPIRRAPRSWTKDEDEPPLNAEDKGDARFCSAV